MERKSLYDYCLENEDKKYLLEEWDYEKNEIEPTEVTSGNPKKVWWKCKRGHSWEAVINNRVKGNGCPYCANKKALPGYNDLATTYPDLAKEWDYEKNEIEPTEITFGSHKKTWWKCKKGHSWQAIIYNRTKGSGCPYCSKGTSKSEGALYLMLSSCFKKVYHRHKIAKTEYDICIEDIKLLIEYDGWLWHKDRREQDSRKEIIAKKNGYQFVRIWEYDSKKEFPNEIKLTHDTFYYDVRKGYDFAALCQMFKYYLGFILKEDLDMSIPLNLDQKIEEYLSSIDEENSIATLYPEIASEWHPSLNGKLTPNDFTKGSNYKAYWICSKGHSYQSSIYNRVEGKGCPYCSNKKVLKGYNDLSTTHPELLEEWDYEKNDIKPTEITSGSPKKVWWKCKQGHSWNATIASRTQGCGCPYCSNQKVLKDFNDLATTHPFLLEEWDYEKNVIKPIEMTAGSHMKVWWKCKEGHSWKAIIYNRVNDRGCPYCSNKKILAGYNDLATTHPSLLEEWNYEKNEIKPTEITLGSGKKVWWKCKKGHSWSAAICERIYHGTGCPYCANKKVLKGYNDLATTHPSLLEEWDYEKNNIKPTEITFGSNKKVWWKCEKGHSWNAVVAIRTKGAECPYCKKEKKALKQAEEL